MKKNKFFKKLFRKKMTLGQAILFLVVGAILGTVFTFGQQYWKAPIEREEAITVESGYSYHTQRLVRPDSHAVNIYCTDGEIYSIDAHCVTYDILDYLDTLQKGTKLDMLIHPNSDTILSLDVNGENILDFDEVIDDTRPYTLFDPVHTWKKKTFENYTAINILKPIFKNGEFVYKKPHAREIRDYCLAQIDTLWQEVKRFENPHKYYVDLSAELWQIRADLLEKYN